MTGKFLAGLCCVLGGALFACFVERRKDDRTVAEHKRAAWHGLTPRYRQTQRGKWWTLRLQRKQEHRRIA
jgi:hypothetical protein